MKEPQRVADCVAAIKAVVNMPVTVKTRIGVDDHDDYQHLYDFIKTVAAVGCEVFIVHARKAWLKGLSPKENRQIPPLHYATVYQLKKDFPQLQIIVNGGIKSIEAIDQHLQFVDGVMLGRIAYQQPLLLTAIEQRYFNHHDELLTPQNILLRYIPYLNQQLASGVKQSSLVRHLHGLYQGHPGAKRWRRYLHERVNGDLLDIQAIRDLNAGPTD
jgi:tRNA-dihydrouridine synthase A